VGLGLSSNIRVIKKRGGLDAITYNYDQDILQMRGLFDKRILIFKKLMFFLRLGQMRSNTEPMGRG